MERMKQMYTEAIGMVKTLSEQDPRFGTFLGIALERMELGVECNIPQLFHAGFLDLDAVSAVLHFNIHKGKVEA